ncbi:MAG: hypothetical protein WKF81_10040, partial [Thermomicrobiales bacterium]
MSSITQRPGGPGVDPMADIESSPYGIPGETISENVSPTGSLTVSDEHELASGERLLTLNMGPQH